MGEISDLIILGVFCEACGSVIDGEATGYPRRCYECEEEDEDLYL
jgi:hypothetical protein